ncbi:hypothetical protein [Burkholderia sp. BCC0322]|nr:hypothetical protein [Burkholderia sp. BCC0322]
MGISLIVGGALRSDEWVSIKCRIVRAAMLAQKSAESGYCTAAIALSG